MTNLFLLAFWHKLIWEKATTKKRITILMKETKIKSSSLSLTLKPGNKILVCLIIFLSSDKTRTQNKRWAGFNNNFDFDDCTESQTPGVFSAGKINMPINDFHSRKCLFNSFTWLFFG